MSAKNCTVCGVEYVPGSGASRYCSACAKKIRREKSNESKRRSREQKRIACMNCPQKMTDCIAMCGGINLSQCIPKSAGNEDSRFGAFRSAVLYNLGRVISYTGIGFLLGLLGMLVGETTGAGISPFFQGILKMIAGVFMVIMGINMLGIFPWLRRFQLQLPRFLVRNVNQKKAKSSQPFVIDKDRKEVCKQGKPVALTPIEWKLLTALTRYPQKVFTREDLIELAFGLDFSGYDRVIDTHVKNLRKKLEDDPKQPVYICTVHGMGYKFGGFRE